MMMQSGREDVLYKNSFDCLMKTLRREGMRGLYKGYVANLYRGVGGALLLAWYDRLPI